MLLGHTIAISTVFTVLTVLKQCQNPMCIARARMRVDMHQTICTCDGPAYRLPVCTLTVLCTPSARCLLHTAQLCIANTKVCYLQLRMYRVVWFYQWCEYSSNIRLLWLTLFRNMSVGHQSSRKQCCIQAGGCLDMPAHEHEAFFQFLCAGEQRLSVTSDISHDVVFFFGQETCSITTRLSVSLCCSMRCW